MKYNAAVPVLAAAALLLAAVSCNRPAGAENPSIRFCAAMPATGSATRVSYSGVVTDGVERLDWNAGDLIRVGVAYPDATPSAVSEYAITAEGTPDGRYSLGSMSLASGDGLFWGTGRHNFTAICPSPSKATSDGTLADLGFSLGDGTAGAYIPASQELSWTGTAGVPDMGAVPLVAYVKGAVPVGDVQLAFRPAFNTFEFAFRYEKTTAMHVNSFTLSSATEALAGAYSLSFSRDTGGYGIPSAATLTPPEPVLSGSGANNAVSVTVDRDMVDGDQMTITVFTVPGDHADLTLSLDTDLGRKSLLLRKKDASSLIFPSCGKARISGLVIPNSPFVSFVTVLLVDDETVITDLLYPWDDDEEEVILIRQ